MVSKNKVNYEELPRFTQVNKDELSLVHAYIKMWRESCLRWAKQVGEEAEYAEGLYFDLAKAYGKDKVGYSMVKRLRKLELELNTYAGWFK